MVSLVSVPLPQAQSPVSSILASCVVPSLSLSHSLPRCVSPFAGVARETAGEREQDVRKGKESRSFAERNAASV